MVVFDSSTLILLAKAELLEDFVNDYKGDIILPDEVKDECCSKKNSFDALLISRMIDERKIKVAKIHNKGLSEKLMTDFSIAMGEAQALVLFLEKRGKLFAVDDKNAIKACRILKIPFTTALAIFVRLVEMGIIKHDRARKKLVHLAAYGRYKDTMIREAKERLNLEEG